MARIATDPNYSSPTFPRATAATDLFLKEDVQALAAAVSTHDHTSGKGLVLPAGAISTGLITSAMIADGTIATADLADGSVTTAKLAALATAQVGSAFGSTSGPQTSSGSFVDMPEITVTLTTTGGDLLCWLNGSFQSDITGSGGVFALALDGADGSPQYSYRWTTANLPNSVAIAYRFSPAAGSHTIKGRWAILVSGNLGCVGISRQLIVMEVKR